MSGFSGYLRCEGDTQLEGGAGVISAWWLVAAYALGGLMGMVILAIVVAGRDDR